MVGGIVPIEVLVDGGRQRPGDAGVGVAVEFCARAHGEPRPLVEAGSEFCRACRAWLSEDTDEDPLS